MLYNVAQFYTSDRSGRVFCVYSDYMLSVFALIKFFFFLLLDHIVHSCLLLFNCDLFLVHIVYKLNMHWVYFYIIILSLVFICVNGYNLSIENQLIVIERKSISRLFGFKCETFDAKCIHIITFIYLFHLFIDIHLDTKSTIIMCDSFVLFMLGNDTFECVMDNTSESPVLILNWFYVYVYVGSFRHWISDFYTTIVIIINIIQFTYVR